jgi:hypothetical protein
MNMGKRLLMCLSLQAVRYTPVRQIAKNGGYHIAGKKFAQLGL